MRAVALVGAALLLLATSGTAHAYPKPAALKGNVAAHDPSMIRSSSGYSVFSTHNSIEIRRSTDRVGFTRTGAALPSKPSWHFWYNVDGDAWAPDVSYHGGRYLLYYSVSSFGSNNSAIGLAVSRTAEPGTWVDQGIVYTSSTWDNYNAIDPSLLVDASGRWWLSFGSFWSGIHMIRIDPVTGKQSRTDTARRHLALRPEGTHAVEAPHIVRHGAYYYMFVSFDRCCARAESTYRIMVGRSTDPTGPYTDRAGVPMLNGGGTQILGTHGNIIGPGGQSVMRDGAEDVLVYHYYDGAAGGREALGLNRLGWDSQGWPYVR
ncbi:arabinan endo-1,5-alpha-L-arabinosidase [Lentzea flaviverrucosa]|uniref:Arabinan endo-1,5-alpha-L-arabinosidase n=1 Tax=Lentzea flaviverrucosa TaxID=200379 RepID=A0A1H9XTA1_9PSEU|nr:arabinan endo-1,5-alpha-L-arabinosidase [Lentzea flaviverrucosa]RDI19355.1 arabinan endo-1,5-alpha-L-arabinosidase [Lentzea flaviverrucosa]SES48947.1 arabinan endo-1,5-alpha-L-arabinosidase [Lentzea flaviverrucosa]